MCAILASLANNRLSPEYSGWCIMLVGTSHKGSVEKQQRDKTRIHNVYNSSDSIYRDSDALRCTSVRNINTDHILHDDHDADDRHIDTNLELLIL